MATAWLTTVEAVPAQNMLQHLFFPELLRWDQQHGILGLWRKADCTDYNLRVDWST